MSNIILKCCKIMLFIEKLMLKKNTAEGTIFLGLIFSSCWSSTCFNDL